jgi:hypothetical protein
MAKKHSSRRKARKPKIIEIEGHQLTPAMYLDYQSRRRAIAYLQKNGGPRAFAEPRNRLIGDSTAQTIERCRCIVSWVAHVHEPFHRDELEAAKADILHSVADALAHAEMVLRRIGSAADEVLPHG